MYRKMDSIQSLSMTSSSPVFSTLNQSTKLIFTNWRLLGRSLTSNSLPLSGSCSGCWSSTSSDSYSHSSCPSQWSLTGNWSWMSHTQRACLLRYSSSCLSWFSWRNKDWLTSLTCGTSWTLLNSCSFRSFISWKCGTNSTVIPFSRLCCKASFCSSASTKWCISLEFTSPLPLFCLFWPI